MDTKSNSTAIWIVPMFSKMPWLKLESENALLEALKDIDLQVERIFFLNV